MNWKTEYQLLDLDEGTRLGLTCKKCGLYQPQTITQLLTKFEPRTYLYEIENTITCKKWGCGGEVRLELSNDFKLEGFQGGIA